MFTFAQHLGEKGLKMNGLFGIFFLLVHIFDFKFCLHALVVE